MPLRLDIKRKLTARSDRVKSCDLHPTEQWMLVSLYNGNVHIWNHESQQLVKSFEVCELPVRAAIFVPRKNWVVTGSDDMQVRVRRHVAYFLLQDNIFSCHFNCYRFVCLTTTLWNDSMLSTPTRTMSDPSQLTQHNHLFSPAVVRFLVFLFLYYYISFS